MKLFINILSNVLFFIACQAVALAKAGGSGEIELASEKF